jgi:hypothetical protein
MARAWTFIARNQEVTLCKPCHGPQPRRKKGQPDLEVGKERVPAIGMSLPFEVYDALKAFATEQERSLNQTMAILVREALIQLGLVPPRQVPGAWKGT